MNVVLRFALLAPMLLSLSGCFSFFSASTDGVAPADRQLPASTQALLAIKGMTQDTPIFVRIFKEESELEVWKLKDGRFQLFRSYPICAWSGGLGPKVQQGDHQAPEGFYTVSRGQMNPHSLYHLAFNIGFPNAYDHANGHTGSALMVHGDCKSVGCYAMTDAYIEEIYILAREAFNAGQTKFHVHAFPFRMTADNMQRHRDSPWYPFWVKLKEGYDSFEAAGKLPIVKVCSKQYMVNVSFPGQPDPAPDAACPVTYAKVDPAQMQGIDGVPASVLANLNKPAQSKPATPAAPETMTATLQPAPQTPAMATAALAMDTSASPVVTRPVAQPAHPTTALASLQPAKPSVPSIATAPTALQPAPLRVGAPSAVQPVNYQVGPAATQSTPPPVRSVPADGQATSEDPSKAVDPNALQKPNRSGKGGKLAPSSAQADIGGTSADTSGSGQR